MDLGIPNTPMSKFSNQTICRPYVEQSTVDTASEQNLSSRVCPMLATGNGDLWLMSTSDGPRGFFWDEWEVDADRGAGVGVPPDFEVVSGGGAALR